MTRFVLAFALALSPLTACKASEAPAATSSAASAPNAENRYTVSVDASGYHPGTLNVHAGQPATLVITRTSDEGCGQQIMFPSLNLRKDLPLNQPVEVHFTPTAGEIAFTCGMNMMRGTIIAQ